MDVMQKYMDQNNYSVTAMKPAVYQTTDTKMVRTGMNE